MLKFHNNPSAYCNLGGLKEHNKSAPLRGISVCSVLSLSQGIFSQSWSFQRAHVPIGCSTLCFLVTGDVSTSFLAIETNDMLLNSPPLTTVSLL